MNDNEQLDKLFERAVTLPPEERQRFVEQKCQGDLQLAAELTSLIRHYEKVHDEGYLEDVQAQEIFGMLRGSDAPGDWAENLECGQVGHYRLLGKIGEGGMGAVYRAVHVKLEKQFAVKILPHNQTRNQNAVARFEREMKAVGQLAHPNIVTASYADQHDGIHYLVVELVDGWDFETLLAAHGRLPLVDACELIRQAAIGLQHAFEHGLVHRDIKPSNLMLNRAGQVKVLDLGLACLHSTEGEKTDLTPSGQILGTPSYMSPEQVLGAHGVDIRSDIYSLGVTLYTLLAGEPPFSGAAYDTPAKKMVALASEEPPRIGERCPELPTELIKIVDQMMARDPAGRYREPVAVAEALLQFAKNADLLAMSARTQEICKTGPDDGSLQSTASQARSALQDTGVTETSDRIESNRDSGVVNATQPERKARRQPRFRLSPLRRGLIVLLALVLIAALSTGVIIRLRGNPASIELGELRIEISEQCPATMEVRIFRDESIFRDELTVERGQSNTLRVMKGSYRVELVGIHADGFEIQDDELTVRSGSVGVVRIVPTTQDEDNDNADQSKLERVLALWMDKGSVQPPQHFQFWTMLPKSPTGDVSSFASGLQGELLAYATSIGQLHVRRMTDLGLVRILNGEYGDVQALAFRPDGTVLVSGHMGGWVRWWRPDGTCSRRSRDSNQPVRCLVWDRIGSRCAIARDTLIEVRDADGNHLYSISTANHGLTSDIGGVAWSPDGQYLASGHKGGTIIWDVRDTKNVREHARHLGVGETWTAVSWGMNGSLAIRDGDDRRFVILDPSTRRRQTIEAKGYSEIVSWHPTAKFLATCGARGIQLWTPSGMKVGESKPIKCQRMAWNSLGTSILTCARNVIQEFPVDSFFDQVAGQRSLVSAPGLSVLNARWRKQGDVLAAEMSDHRLLLLQKDGTILHELRSHPTNVLKSAWSPDGAWLAAPSADNTVQLWSASGVAGPQLTLGSETLLTMTWRPDGLYAATGSDRSVKIWNTQGDCLASFDVPARVRSLAWSQGGQTIAAGLSELHGVRIWQLEDETEFKASLLLSEAGARLGLRDNVNITEFSPDDRFLLMGGTYGSLVILDTNTLFPRQLSGHTLNVNAAAWNPGGDPVACGGTEGTLTMWYHPPMVRQELMSHEGPITSLQWSVDGKALAAAGSVGVISLFDGEARAISRLPGHVGAITSLDWHPIEESRLAIATNDGRLYQWDTQSTRLLSMLLFRENGSVLRFSSKGSVLGATEDDLDYLKEGCSFRITGHDGTAVYVPYSDFERLAD